MQRAPKDKPVHYAFSCEGASRRLTDPLLACLALVLGLLGTSRSEVSLASGLPLPDDHLTPGLFCRAAGLAGFAARHVHQPLAEMQPLLLPCVLLLQMGQACVLVGRPATDRLQVIFPENAAGVVDVAMSDLEAQYLGQAIFVRPRHRTVVAPESAGRWVGAAWFWPEISKHWWVFLQVIVASLTVNVLALAVPLFVMNVYDRVVPNQAMETLWVLAIGVVVVLGFDFLLKFLRHYFVDITGQRLDTLLSCRIYEKLLRVRPGGLPWTAGDLANRVQGYERLREFFSSLTLFSFVDLPFAALFVGLIGLFGGLMMACVQVVAAIVLLCLGLFFQGPLRRVMAVNFSDAALRNGFLVETIQQLLTIKILGAEGRLQRRWDSIVDGTVLSAARERGLANTFLLIAGLITSLSYIFLVVVGVYQIQAGVLTMGGLIACSILSGRVMAPLVQIASILARLQQTTVAFHGLNQLMALPEETALGRQLLHRESFSGDFSLKGVYFKYPQQTDMALKNITVSIRQGERVGIVGRSGSGKSTLVKLLAGIYPVGAGQVLVDGIDIGQLDPAEYRAAVAFAAQDSHLFAGTVRDNIRLAAPHLSDEEIMGRLRLTGLDAVVKNHPLGLDRQVGANGCDLSGGEKQAVILARTLATPRPIVLLDEPTASMDLMAEQVFIDHCAGVLAGSTVVLVSQRLALLELVERLIVIKDGMVLADGPRGEVLAAMSSGRV